MDSKNHILVAEDDETLLEVFESLLASHFEVSTAITGLEAVEKIKTERFLFVILDIHLPGKSGLEICQVINDMPPGHIPHVVILSGDSNPETIRQAYELNVDDYILKPVNGLNFVKRMCRLERDLLHLNQLVNQQGKAHDLANTAMSQAAGYGGAFDLISRLNAYATPIDVARAVVDFIKVNGYFSAVEIRGFEQLIHLDVDSQTCGEVELKIFEVLHDQGRVYAFGKRCIFNDNLVSLLVKNMPAPGSNEADLLIDVAAKLVPAINIRLQALRNELTLRETTSILQNALKFFADGVTAMQSNKQRLLHDLERKVSEGFNQLGMSEEQEHYFIRLVENMIDENAADSNFEKLNDLLAGCHLNIHRCLEGTNQNAQEEEANTGVELF